VLFGLRLEGAAEGSLGDAAQAGRGGRAEHLAGVIVYTIDCA